MTDNSDFDATASASAEGLENAQLDLHEAALDDSGSFQQAGEAELMLAELTHRVNNELASLLAVATREMSQVGDVSCKAAIRRLQSRLKNVSHLHQALQPWKDTGHIDAGQYLHDLCEALQHSVLGNVTLHFSGSHCPLAVRQCWRLGMAVAEFVANAQRHGFAGGRGNVHIEIKRLSGYVRCSVADDGAGSEGLVPGRGLKIVAALVRGLRGQLRHESQGTGTTWTITIPIAPFSHGAPSAAPHGLRSVQTELT